MVYHQHVLSIKTLKISFKLLVLILEEVIVRKGSYCPEPSEMSVGAGWQCLWVLAFCAGCWLVAGVPYNREKKTKV